MKKSQLRNIINEEVRKLLFEKTFNIDNDVDFLYEKYFKDDIREIKKTGKITDEMFETESTSTKVLKNENCQLAHKLNPCDIIINNNMNYPNCYDPNKNRIFISASSGDAASFIINQNTTIQQASELLSGDQKEMLLNEFTKSKIKGTIHHELVHWLDETLHNKRITKKMKKTDKQISHDSSIEIEAEIHNIYELYRVYKKRWDLLTFDDVLKLIPSLNSTKRKLDKKRYLEWKKNLKHRMAREGLLGKNMKNI